MYAVLLNYTIMENQTNTNEFNHEASLKVIYEMIESAKSKIGRNYFYYLFWGYLVALTSLTELFLITVIKYAYHFLVWPVLMPAGCIITFIFHWRQNKLATSKTYIGKTMGYLWTGWLISVTILLLFANLKQDYTAIIPLILAMYGMAIFVSGGIVGFRPLIWGGIIGWMASATAFFMPYTVQLLIMTGTVIISYIIPGHLLKRRSKV